MRTKKGKAPKVKMSAEKREWLALQARAGVLDKAADAMPRNTDAEEYEWLIVARSVGRLYQRADAIIDGEVMDAIDPLGEDD